jgi:hypothetical protein
VWRRSLERGATPNTPFTRPKKAGSWIPLILDNSGTHRYRAVERTGAQPSLKGAWTHD